MKRYHNTETAKIINLPSSAWYDADRPPLRVRLQLLKTILATILSLAWLGTDQLIDDLVCQLITQPLDLIGLALPTIRIYLAALIIELATALAGQLAPAYVGG